MKTGTVMKSKKIGLDKINTELGKLYLETLEKTNKYKIGEPIFVIVKNLKDPEFIFVESDIGSGVLLKEEFYDEYRNITINIGETIPVFYLGTKNGENYFTTVPKPPYVNLILENAKIHKIPLKGKIDSILESGCHVKIGEILTFCPKSKLKKDVIKNETLNFLVIEVNKNQCVVSYIDYIAKQKDEFKKNLTQSLKIGSIINGKITSITSYGISIDLGYGLEAFIPNSEISYKNTQKNLESFKRDSEVKAKIIQLDWKEDKIIASIKELQDNPWLGTLPFKKGDILDVSIVNIKRNGLAVALEDGFIGFIPIKEIHIKQKQLNKEFSVNQRLRAMIIQIDTVNQKILLSLKQANEYFEMLDYQKYLENQQQEEETIGSILFKSIE